MLVVCDAIVSFLLAIIIPMTFDFALNTTCTNQQCRLLSYADSIGLNVGNDSFCFVPLVRNSRFYICLRIKVGYSFACTLVERLLISVLKR